MVSRLYLPTRIYIGAGVVDRLGAEANRFGQRCVILTGRNSARRSGLLDKVATQLQEQHNHFVKVIDGIDPNPSLDFVLNLAKRVKIEDPHYIIAIGGGAVLDSAGSG